MICPKDLVQMHQYKKMGGGNSTDDVYSTYEIKECPVCDRKVLEYYNATLIDEEIAKKLDGKGSLIITFNADLIQLDQSKASLTFKKDEHS